MRKIVSCILVMVLLASAAPLAVTPAGAQEFVPGDKEPYDMIISKDELVSVILLYMLGESGHPSLDEVREIAHIHVYYPRTITDSADRTVTVYKPVKRMIVFAGRDLLRALGATDKIVGITTHAHENPAYYFEYQHLPGFKFGAPDYEGMAALHPDLVVYYGEETHWKGGGIYEIPEDKIHSIGAEIIYTDTQNLAEDITKPVKILAKITETEERGEEPLEWYEETLEKIERYTEGLEKPRVLFLSYPNYKMYSTKGAGSNPDMMINWAGGINIAANLSDGNVDPEWIAFQNPDVIIAKAAYVRVGDKSEALSVMEETRKLIINDPGCKKTNAVNNSRIYLYGDIGAAELGAAAYTAYMAKCLHPDIPVDPEETLKTWFELQGVDYENVEQKTVFWYPEPS